MPDGIGYAFYERLINYNVIQRFQPRQEVKFAERSEKLDESLKTQLKGIAINQVDIADAHFISVASNGNPSALVFSEKHNIFNVFVDFTPNDLFSPASPHFVSLVGLFSEAQDWRILAEKDRYFHFSLYSPNKSISKIKFELDSPGKGKIVAREYNISDDSIDVYVGADEFKNLKFLDKISEICFVVQSIYMDGKKNGNFILSIDGIT